jgi:hypothetical protein
MGALNPANSEAPPHIVVTWPSDRAKQLGTRSARSVDDGKTFSSSVSVGDPAVQGSEVQAVAIGADQRTRAVWVDQRRERGTPHHANACDD